MMKTTAQDVMTITPDTHLLVILDIMIKKHIRRIPVVEGNKIKGSSNNIETFLVKLSYLPLWDPACGR